MKKWKSLGVKLSSRIIIIMVLLCVMLFVVSYELFQSRFIEFYEDKAENISKITASLIDGDQIGKYVLTLEKDAYYQELETIFSKVKEQAGVAYLYLFVPQENGFVYIIDGKSSADSENNIAKLGDYYEYSETEYSYLLPDVLNKRASDRVIIGEDVGFGRSVTAWAPVLDSKGNVVAMVEADYYLTEVYEAIYYFQVRIAAILIIGFGAILSILLLNIRSLVVLPLKKLTSIVSSYENGDFSDEFISITTEDEMQLLAESFGDMAKKIDEYIENIRLVTAEKERISTELSVATQIQADMLPSIFPAFPERKEFDVFASMKPAKEVGGDFYDFFLTDENHLAMIIADVSGKGVPAALFMVIAKTLLKNQTQMGGTPHEILESVNNQLCENNQSEMFVTVWLGIMEISTGKVIAANAGHEYPAIRKADGSFELLRDRHGLVLAAIEDTRYTDYEFEIEPDGVLYVYTDGVTEAMGMDRKLFGLERMVDALNQEPLAELKQLSDNVHGAIHTFVGSAPQFDDITMLAVRREEAL